jgi:Asp-tRNA(Asn)/Glu-tRNA(Gln) amidotransferase A subunit family amidase
MSPEGLPIGCQLTARMWDEAALVRAGAAYQTASDWHLKTPALAGA